MRPAKLMDGYLREGLSPRAAKGRFMREMCIRDRSQGLRAAGAARKGGTPGEGPPFDPLLRFFGIRVVSYTHLGRVSNDA